MNALYLFEVDTLIYSIFTIISFYNTALVLNVIIKDSLDTTVMAIHSKYYSNINIYGLLQIIQQEYLSRYD